jgi:hypothetical protein
MPTIAEHPSLTVRLEAAVASLLADSSGLGDISVRTGTEDGSIGTPYIVVNAHRIGERIHNSGVYDCEVRIHLKTTMGNGPKATDDATLLALDAAIEAVVFGDSPRQLAADITTEADFLRCDAVLSPRSEPTVFDDTRREITYSFTAVCIHIPDTSP